MERYVPHRPLPAAAFVPGRAGSVRPAAAPEIEGRTLPPGSWRENEAWLFGADLWNHGFLWEAHEVWEQVWRAPFDARQAELLRGLIQCAAAGLKIAVGTRRGADRLARAGTERIERAAAGEVRTMGLDACAFAAAFRAFVAADPDGIGSRPRIELA